MAKSLEEWQAQVSPQLLAQLPNNWQRRQFLRQSLKAAAVMTLAPSLITSLAGCQQKPDIITILSQEPWLSIATVQQHLFPSDKDSPGAREIHADGYLYQVLLTPDFDPEERQFILDGVMQLDKVSLELQQQRFIKLNDSQRESVLQELTQYRVGDRWLGALLTYIMEALLSDPIYGGNPNGIGWQWLQHIPGFPRPPQPYSQQLK